MMITASYRIDLRYLFGLALLLVSCQNDSPRNEEAEAQQPVMMEVAQQQMVGTRASQTPLPKDARYACNMFYQSGVNSTEYNASVTAWLLVNADNGNSIYRQGNFAAPAETDDFLFDKSAPIFYWQNRKAHAFVALADFHRLSGATAGNGLPSEAEMAKAYSDDPELPDGEKYVTYALKPADSYEQMPDPIRAVVTKKPSGYTPEANRVSLLFKHCFSQVQVNLMPSPDGSTADLTADQIVSVELMGVSTEGYVAPWIDPSTGEAPPPTYKPVLATDYTLEEWEASKRYGTAMKMFELSEPTTGYLKSFQTIAFGLVRALRITWLEKTNGADITHEAVRSVEEQYQTLKSGTRHIFNIQLRRGMLAVLDAAVIPWEVDDTSYTTDGSIDTGNH